MTTTLPSVGPGALQSREDPNQRAGSDVQNMGPATDFYKKLSLDCSGQQVDNEAYWKFFFPPIFFQWIFVGRHELNLH